jgi:hypothetical protein
VPKISCAERQATLVTASRQKQNSFFMIYPRERKTFRSILLNCLKTWHLGL